MKTQYAKLTGGKLELFKNPLTADGMMYFNPEESLLIKNGWKIYSVDAIDDTKRQTHNVTSEYKETDTTITKTYEYQFDEQKTKTYFSSEIQRVMDEKAQELDYDDIGSAVTYFDDDNPKFSAEGKAFKSWRSAVWTYSNEQLKKALTGEIEVPEINVFLASLPELTISYPEGINE